MHEGGPIFTKTQRPSVLFRPAGPVRIFFRPHYNRQMFPRSAENIQVTFPMPVAAHKYKPYFSIATVNFIICQRFIPVVNIFFADNSWRYSPIMQFQ